VLMAIVFHHGNQALGEYAPVSFLSRHVDLVHH